MALLLSDPKSGQIISCLTFQVGDFLETGIAGFNFLVPEWNGWRRL